MTRTRCNEIMQWKRWKNEALAELSAWDEVAAAIEADTPCPLGGHHATHALQWVKARTEATP